MTSYKVVQRTSHTEWVRRWHVLGQHAVDAQYQMPSGFKERYTDIGLLWHTIGGLFTE